MDTVDVFYNLFLDWRNNKIGDDRLDVVLDIVYEQLQVQVIESILI